MTVVVAVLSTVATEGFDVGCWAVRENVWTRKIITRPDRLAQAFQNSFAHQGAGGGGSIVSVGILAPPPSTPGRPPPDRRTVAVDGCGCARSAVACRAAGWASGGAARAGQIRVAGVLASWDPGKRSSKGHSNRKVSHGRAHECASCEQVGDVPTHAVLPVTVLMKPEEHAESFCDGADCAVALLTTR